jgi:hypothetical protein
MAFFGNTGGQNPFNSWVGYGGDGSVPSGVPDAMSGVGAALSQNAATPPKRSFFGKLANALGNDDAQMNFAAAAAYASGKPEVAAQIINATQQRRNELQMYEQRQKDERDNWLYEQQYKAEHPEPINNDTANDYAFWQGKLSPQEFEVWKANRINPPHMVTRPDGSMVMVGGYDPGQGAGASGPPPGAIDHLRQNPALAPQFDQKYGPGSASRVLGGASPSNGSATFPF